MPASAGTGCGPTSVVFDSSLTEYDFGPQHPMAPVRVDLTIRLAVELGIIAPERLRMVDAPMASDDLIATVHAPALIEAVSRMKLGTVDIDLGLGTEDNPTFDHMHHAAAHVVGASVEACRQVWSGESIHSANVAGGLHHAMRERASGFCIYNDVAVGIQWLLDQGARRVAYVDVDVHHGDGVERIFWDGCSPSPCTRPAGCCSPVPVSPRRPAGLGRRVRRSTSPSRRGPPTVAGCARSTPSSRRSCASGVRKYW